MSHKGGGRVMLNLGKSVTGGRWVSKNAEISVTFYLNGPNENSSGKYCPLQSIKSSE